MTPRLSYSLFNFLLNGFVFHCRRLLELIQYICSMFLKNNVNCTLCMQSTIVEVLLALCLLIHVFCTVF